MVSYRLRSSQKRRREPGCLNRIAKEVRRARRGISSTFFFYKDKPIIRLMTADWKRAFGPNFRKCACTICERRHERMHLTLKTAGMNSFFDRV